jgi:hypothetical protein
MSTDAPFIPLCMTPEELAGWEAHNVTAAATRGGRTVIPCSDCLPRFADEMWVLRRCNGIPRGAEPDEEPERRGHAPSICRCGHYAGTHRRRASDGRMVCHHCQRNRDRSLHDYEPESSEVEV